MTRTFFLLWTVQPAAEIRCPAGAMAGDDVALPTSSGERCAAPARQLIAADGFAEKWFAEKWFAAMVRRMRSRR